MNVKINGLVARIVGIVAILIAVSMIGPIYTANAAISANITNATNTTSFLVLPTLLPFGPIIILLGLIFTGGLLVVRPNMGVGINYMVGTVVSIVGVIVILSMFPSLIIQFDTTLTTLLAASDSIGVLFIGTVLPLLLYLLVAVAPSVMPAYSMARGGQGRRQTASAMAY